MAERLHRVIEEHHAEARHDPVQATGRERVLLRVGDDEIHRQSGSLRALARQGDHRGGDVDPGDVCIRTQAPGHAQRHRAGAAAHIQHAQFVARRDRVQQVGGQRREHLVEKALRVHPGLTGRAIP